MSNIQLDIFKNKILLITGGTGSFGNTVLENLINSDINEIRIFSRDEKKQDDMRKKYKDERISFFLGDIRDQQAVDNALNGVNYVFHIKKLENIKDREIKEISNFGTFEGIVLFISALLTIMITSNIKFGTFYPTL